MSLLVPIIRAVSPFLNHRQLSEMVEGLAGTEGEYLEGVFRRLKKTIERIPLPETATKRGNEAVAYLRYLGVEWSSAVYVLDNDPEWKRDALCLEIIDGRGGLAEFKPMSIESLTTTHLMDVGFKPMKLGCVKYANGVPIEYSQDVGNSGHLVPPFIPDRFPAKYRVKIPWPVFGMELDACATLDEAYEDGDDLYRGEPTP